MYDATDGTYRAIFRLIYVPETGIHGTDMAAALFHICSRNANQSGHGGIFIFFFFIFFVVFFDLSDGKFEVE